jgi:hypothetical protein
VPQQPSYGASPQQAYGAPPQQPYGAPAMPGPSPFAPAAPQQPAAYGPGALVLVHWADGNRYPATVLQNSGGQVLVAFPSGQQQWVDVHYVSSGS